MLSARFAQPRNMVMQSMPAPTGGINDLDPLAVMEKGYALSLIDFFPDTGSIVTRDGYQRYVEGIGRPIDTLMIYNRNDGSSNLFAGTNVGIYDTTFPTQAPLNVYAATNGFWDYCNFGNIAGTYLICANGIDPAVLYDGVNWITFTEVASPVSPGQVSGLDPRLLKQPISHQGRLWFLQKDSLVAWYLPTDAVAGELRPFYFGGVFKRGGKVISIATWSTDSGSGVSDRLVIITSTGEIAVYEGTDPNSIETWKLFGIFYGAPPLGDRVTLDFGGDVIILTELGLVPLSRLIQGEGDNSLSESVLTRRISHTLSRLTAVLTYNRGFQLVNYANYYSMYINIPASANAPPLQLVMNMLTGAWCRFTLPATCMVIFQKALLFGTADGKVLVSAEGILRDDIQFDGTGGLPILAYAMSAFSDFGDPANIKSLSLVRPVFIADKPPAYKLKAALDYAVLPFPQQPQNPGVSGQPSLWDEALWDVGFWSSGNETYRPWVGVGGVCFAAAMQLKVSAVSKVRLAAIQWGYSPGGAI